MPEPLVPDVIVNVCQHCSKAGSALPRQWRQHGFLVAIREIPCGGKLELPYLMRSVEAATLGVCVVTCPPEACHLGEGSRRATLRTAAVRRLLAGVGLSPERIEHLRCAADSPSGHLEQLIRSAVERLNALGPAWPPPPANARRG
jgi:coenzyme F420-reducing hydrogenase delta subunit